MGIDAISYRACRSRDARFDGRFFVGVVTTGIYCRPVCPAPTPRPENMRVFACAAAAAEAGFRPCRRCRPETAPGTPAWLGTSSTVARALRLIAGGALDESGVDELSARLGVGARHLRRLFLRHVGATPVTVAATRRAHFARRLIDETRLPMTKVAISSGFRSLRRFNEAIHATFGYAPTRLRARVAERRGSRHDVNGGGGVALRLAYRPPFDWDRLLAYLGPRAIPGVESVADGAYRRTIRVGNGTGLIDVRQDPSGRHLTLRIEPAAGHDFMRAVENARRLFDLDADPLAIRGHLRRDPRLARALGVWPGLRVPGAWDGFELAVRAVLGQQVSVRGATTLAGRLVRAWGDPLPEPDGHGLTHVFPPAERLAEADLSGLGLTRSRERTIRALAGAVARDGLRLDTTADVEETRARLCELPGIGEWTAQYVALRALRDPDAFPAGDLGLRRAMARDGKLIAERDLRDVAEAWRPWRGYAAVALWSLPHEPERTRKKASLR